METIHLKQRGFRQTLICPGDLTPPPPSLIHETLRRKRSMNAACHITVIDDHRLIAEGCRSEFQRAGLPWTVTWCKSLVDVDWSKPPSLIILDLRLNDGSRPSQVIGALERRGIPVVVYTSGEAPDLIREAIAAGVMAIVNKTAPLEDLIDAVRAALAGEPTGTLDWARALDEDEDFVATRLTNQEAKVITLYANGVQADKVARILGLSPNSVTTYVSRIKDKYRAAGRLGDGSRVALFKAAARDGLISYYE